MTRRPVLFVAFLLAAGCQPAAPTPANEQIAAMTQMADVLNAMNDDAQAAAAMPRLDEAAARVKAANQRAAEASKPYTPEQKEQVRKEYGEAVKSAGLKLSAAGMAAQLRAKKHAARIQLVFDDVNGLVPAK